MTASFEQLRREMAAAARLTFSAYRQQHPDEQFYAFGLYNDDDAGGANCAASTEQSLERVTKNYSDGGYEVPARGYLRYVPDEWVYSGAEGSIEEWCKVWELNEALHDQFTFPIYKEKALEAMILALKDLDAVGFFGIGPDRERITLLIWITDSFVADKWWRRSIEELNPKSVYNRFLVEFPS